MAMYIRQDQRKTELQQSIAAELQEKRKKNKDLEVAKPDTIDEERYKQGTKQTTTLAWVWVLILIAAIGGSIWFIVMANSQY